MIINARSVAQTPRLHYILSSSTSHSSLITMTCSSSEAVEAEALADQAEWAGSERKGGTAASMEGFAGTDSGSVADRRSRRQAVVEVGGMIELLQEVGTKVAEGAVARSLVRGVRKAGRSLGWDSTGTRKGFEQKEVESRSKTEESAGREAGRPRTDRSSGGSGTATATGWEESTARAVDRRVTPKEEERKMAEERKSGRRAREGEPTAVEYFERARAGEGDHHRRG